MALSENSKRVAALMEEGKDPAAIAKALHMSLEDVHEHRSLVFADMDKQEREKRLQKSDKRKVGRHNSKTEKTRRRTTDDELLDLAELLGAGYKQAYIAEKMDRSVPWVSGHKAQALELWDAKRGEELARQTPPAPVAESRQEEPQKRANPFAEIGAALSNAFGVFTDSASEPEEPEEPDMVNHPPHYKLGKFECMEVLIALLGVEGAKYFCKGNIIKYRYRAAAKNGAEDIAKADRYMEMLKELEGGEHNAAD